MAPVVAEQKGRTKMGEEKAGGAARGKAQHTCGMCGTDWSAGCPACWPMPEPAISAEEARETALHDAMEAVRALQPAVGYDPTVGKCSIAVKRLMRREASTASAPKEPPEPTPDPEARRG